MYNCNRSGIYLVMVKIPISILLFSIMVVSTLSAQSFLPITQGKIATDTTNTNGASWIDFDDDGDLDLFLSNANNPFGFNILYRNEGNDNFIKIKTGEVVNLQAATFGNAWADYDNDGLIDLVVINAFTKMGALLYKNLGDGMFRRNERFDIGNNAIKGFNGAWGDYDNDGFVDLVITHPARFVGLPITSNFLFHNEGDGSFTQVANTPITRTAAPFTNASWTDYDLDGDIDLFIGSGPANGTTAPDFIYKNLLKENGKVAFERLKETVFAKDSLDGQVWNWIDFDNDKDLDAYVTNWGGALGGLKNNLYRNDNGVYVKITKGALVEDVGISLANVWADFDNDGDLDVYVGNGSKQKNRYYKNNGDGTFTSIEKGHFVEQTKNTWGVSVGDYDNDGDLDLFVSNKTRYIKGGDVNFLYRNDLNNNYNWILIQAVGEKSNRSAIGAKVRATAKIAGKEVVQFREIGAQNTFLGQNDLRVHFGFHKAKKIEKIQIEWPSGEVDTYENIDINKIYIATEGKEMIPRK